MGCVKEYYTILQERGLSDEDIKKIPDKAFLGMMENYFNNKNKNE